MDAFEADVVERLRNDAFEASRRAQLRAEAGEEDAKLGEEDAAEVAAARRAAVDDANTRRWRGARERLESKGGVLRRAGVVAEEGALGFPASPRSQPGDSPSGAGGARSLASALPRVASLSVSGCEGGAFHGRTLRAVGHLSRCRCVRFAWLASSGGARFEPLPFAVLPTLFASADLAGCRVCVEATPVSDDGFEGRPRRSAAVGPLGTHPEVLSRVAAALRAVRGSSEEGGGEESSDPPGLLLSDGLWTPDGGRAALSLRPLHVALLAAPAVEPRDGSETTVPRLVLLGSAPAPGCRVALDPRDGCGLSLRGEHGGDSAPQVDFRADTPELRDELALLLRSLSSGARPSDAGGEGGAGAVAGGALRQEDMIPTDEEEVDDESDEPSRASGDEMGA